MSLLDAYSSECVILTKARVDDELGGYKLAWLDGAKFTAAWEYLSASEIIVAEQQGTSRVYRIYVPKTLDLDYHEAFRRISDGQVFRVTNPGKDRHTPASSRLNKRLVEVEKWELPSSDASEVVSNGGNG